MARTSSSRITRTRSRRPRPPAGVPLARIWMHNGMVRTDAEKMSKSLGNIFQLSEAIDRFGAAGGGRVPDLRPLPPAARVLRGGAGAGGGAGRAAAQLPRRGAASAASRDRSSPSGARRSSTRSPTTSTRRGRGRRLFELVAEGEPAARCPARARRSPRCCRCSGSSRCSRPETAEPTRRPRRCSAERERARAERDFARADEHPRPARRARLGGPRHARGRATRRRA